MKKIRTGTITSGLISLVLSCGNLENDAPKKESSLIDTLTNQEKICVVSIELGNPSDQKVFLDYFTGKNPNAKVYHRRLKNFYFPCPTPDSLETMAFAEDLTKEISSNIKLGHFIHLSGHHKANSPLLFGGELINSMSDNYLYRSGIDLTKLSTNTNATQVFLLSCFGVSIYGDFTKMMLEKFPNAVIMGYHLRSAPGTANSILLKNYFDLLDSTDMLLEKKDLARLWIEAGKKTYKKLREVRASWKEDSILYEMDSNRTYKRFLP